MLELLLHRCQLCIENCTCCFEILESGYICRISGGIDVIYAWCDIFVRQRLDWIDCVPISAASCCSLCFFQELIVIQLEGNETTPCSVSWIKRSLVHLFHFENIWVVNNLHDGLEEWHIVEWVGYVVPKILFTTELMYNFGIVFMVWVPLVFDQSFVLIIITIAGLGCLWNWR